MYKLLTVIGLFSVCQPRDWKPLFPTSLYDKDDLIWVDEEDNKDVFFDRVVVVTIEAKARALGVFFTRHHVVTAFNPFRSPNATAEPTELYKPEDIEVVVLTHRILNNPDTRNNYTYVREHPVCMRQIVPPKSLDKIPWHGLDKRHSPLHDLLVLQIKKELNFLPPNPRLYDFGSTGSNINVGPMLTVIASKKDILGGGNNLKMASIAFRNKKHMKINKFIKTREFDSDEAVIEKCEEWFPNQWGNFICIANPDDYPGIGAGAVLIYDNMLFGIGSFLLRKSNISVLVFTDVRPYFKLLHRTCLQSYTLPIKRANYTHN